MPLEFLKRSEQAPSFPLHELPVELMQEILFQLADICEERNTLLSSLQAVLKVYLSAMKKSDIAAGKDFLTWMKPLIADFVLNTKIYALNIGILSIGDCSLDSFSQLEAFLSKYGHKVRRINLAILPGRLCDNLISMVASFAPRLRHFILRNWEEELSRPFLLTDIGKLQGAQKETGHKSITDAVFQPIKKLPLEVLDLSWCSSLTDEGVKELSGSEISELYLKQLSLFTGSAFKSMGLDKLTILDLSETKVTNDTLPHLANFPNLETLHLSGCSLISDAGAVSLAALSLKSLNLAKCQRFTGRVLEVLSSCRTMKQLTLDHCKIDDNSLSHVKKMSLEFLSLSYCYSITAQGVNLLDNTTLKVVKLVGCCWVELAQLNLSRLKITQGNLHT